jgi:hypothetical protein
MRSGAINAPLAVANGRKATVWYSSTTVLKEGQAVCYNWDYATTAVPATLYDGSRLNRVENPTSLNAQFYAGVAACDYPAESGGQMIDIYLPGSLCNIYVAASTVIGVGMLTFSVDAATVGQWISAGLPGEGSAIPMQTTTYVATAQKCMALTMTGQPSGGVEVVPIVDNGAIGTLMIGGTTLVTGATIGAGDCTYTLADGTVPGIRKLFRVITAEIATNDLVVTVTNGATDDIDDTVLATVTWAGAGTTIAQEVTLEWAGAWLVKGRTKTTPALA